LVAEVTKADFTVGEPTNLGPTVNSSAGDTSPSISADGLELYFSSDRPGGYGLDDIYVMTRATTEDDWGEPVNLGPLVNSSTADITPSISADGLELYFCEWGDPRPGGLGHDLWVTTRPTKDDEWGEPVNLATVNSSDYEFTPEISSDGLELYFESNRPGGVGGEDIYVSTRATTEDDWGEPVNLGPTINSSLWEHCPTISADGLTLFFDIDFPAGDLMVTRRATIDDDWGVPVNLGHSASNHWASDISADDSTLFFMSERDGGFGANDLWQVPIIPVVDFNGDGKVDNADICIMAGYWNTDEPSCDIGPTPLGDGIVDAQDMLVLTEYLTKEKVDVEADIAAIEEVLNQYAVTANAGDLEGWLSLHADNVVKMPPDAPAIFGIEALRANFQPAFENFNTNCVIYPEETQVDGDMGFARGTYSISITPKAGGETIDVMKDGKYLTICKRQADGTWKISHDCYNSNIPPAQ
jgi:uncharacterized protein (TIGR02246 family)